MHASGGMHSRKIHALRLHLRASCVKRLISLVFSLWFLSSSTYLANGDVMTTC